MILRLRELAVGTFLAGSLAVSSWAEAAAGSAPPEVMANAGSRGIANIRAFLDQCPTNDPAFSQIILDFEIRRNGVVRPVPFCMEPVSSMAVADYTDELIVLQGLRVIYYMDRGQSGHLPWTSGALYDWMKSKIQGVNIVPGFSYCCDFFPDPNSPPPPPPPPPGSPPPPPPPPGTPAGKRLIGVSAQDDFNREFDKKWIGISGNIGLYAHEVRHVDGFFHVSCCGIPNGCDSVFDPSNLSAYGTQWWLNQLWLNGTINVGYACPGAPEVPGVTNFFVSGVNDYRARFCDSLPALVGVPAVPFGPCASGRRRAARR